MKIFRIVALTLLGMLVLLLGLDYMKAASVSGRARTIRVGDSKNQVEAVLGRPAHVFRPLPDASTNVVAIILSVDSETWAYGRTFDLQAPFRTKAPFISPLEFYRYRLFKPYPDDTAIAFDASGKVISITVP
jgi:hypothetical protein